MKRILAIFCALALTVAAHAATYTNGSASAGLSNSATLVSATRCTVTHYNIYNPNSTVVFVLVYSAGSTSGITVGTTAPTYVLAVPPYGVTDGPTVAGISLPSGCVIAAVMTAPNTTTGAVAPTSGVWISLSTN